jgi:hypothetical protein
LERMQSLALDTVIVVTATFAPDIRAPDSVKPKRVASDPKASFTHASISAAPYKLSVSREDRKPYFRERAACEWLARTKDALGQLLEDGDALVQVAAQKEHERDEATCVWRSAISVLLDMTERATLTCTGPQHQVKLVIDRIRELPVLIECA